MELIPAAAAEETPPKGCPFVESIVGVPEFSRLEVSIESETLSGYSKLSVGMMRGTFCRTSAIEAISTGELGVEVACPAASELELTPPLSRSVPPTDVAAPLPVGLSGTEELAEGLLLPVFLRMLLLVIAARALADEKGPADEEKGGATEGDAEDAAELVVRSSPPELDMVGGWEFSWTAIIAVCAAAAAKASAAAP